MVNFFIFLIKMFEKEIKNFLEYRTNKSFIEFVKIFRDYMQSFVNKKITALELSSETVHTFVDDDKNEFFKALKEFDKESIQLRSAMDVTHPRWTEKQREDYVDGLILLADELIEKHS